MLKKCIASFMVLAGLCFYGMQAGSHTRASLKATRHNSLCITQEDSSNRISFLFQCTMRIIKVIDECMERTIMIHPELSWYHPLESPGDCIDLYLPWHRRLDSSAYDIDPHRRSSSGFFIEVLFCFPEKIITPLGTVSLKTLHIRGQRLRDQPSNWFEPYEEHIYSFLCAGFPRLVPMIVDTKNGWDRNCAQSATMILEVPVVGCIILEVPAMQWDGTFIEDDVLDALFLKATWRKLLIHYQTNTYWHTAQFFKRAYRAVRSGHHISMAKPNIACFDDPYSKDKQV